MKKILLTILTCSCLLVGCAGNEKKEETKKNSNNVGTFALVEKTKSVDNTNWILHSRATSSKMVKNFNDLKWKKPAKKAKKYALAFKSDKAYINVLSNKNKVLYGRQFKTVKKDKDINLNQTSFYSNEKTLANNNKDVSSLKKMSKKDINGAFKEYDYYILEGKNKKYNKTLQVYRKENILITVEFKNKRVYYTRYLLKSGK